MVSEKNKLFKVRKKAQQEFYKKIFENKISFCGCTNCLNYKSKYCCFCTLRNDRFNFYLDN